MPGAVGNVLSRGCHALIKQGAVLVENAVDICEALGRPVPVAPEQAFEAGGEASDGGLSSLELQVLKLLEHAPQSLDTLAGRTNVEVDQLLAALMGLEISGRIHSESGHYVLALSPQLS